MTQVRLLPALILLMSSAAWAGEPVPTSGDFDDRAGRFDVEDGLAVLQEMFSLADAYLRDHLDLEGRYQPDTAEGRQGGSLRFRFYPRGRRHSDASIDAETGFEAGQGRFSFHFGIREAPSSGSDDDRYL